MGLGLENLKLEKSNGKLEQKCRNAVKRASLDVVTEILVAALSDNPNVEGIWWVKEGLAIDWRTQNGIVTTVIDSTVKGTDYEGAQLQDEYYRAEQERKEKRAKQLEKANEANEARKAKKATIERDRARRKGEVA